MLLVANDIVGRTNDSGEGTTMGDNVNGPTEDEIYAAIAVLANTERYSVKDNELDDWIA
ncbi:Uncharacterised protein [Mycobacteroides abscessus subsp. massiliense]|nr:Uncharacterised protein [Mycobacteroides abscessus subsp. massiliense]SKT62096.1 Uncharacterised protein [Mycobacteroides abscessus subsp. massiliense]SKT90172.1 Uncharacterised protein [Mycobacteroides abscessus subsp. massiliense]